jgi:hypothetical protein
MSTLDIATAARDIRLAAGLGQEEMAERLGWPPTTLAKIERGESCPWGIGDFGRYRKAFGIDPHVLAWCRGPVPVCVAAEASAIAERLGRVVESGEARDEAIQRAAEDRDRLRAGVRVLIDRCDAWDEHEMVAGLLGDDEVAAYYPDWKRSEQVGS